MTTLERYNLVDDAWSSTLGRAAVTSVELLAVPRRIPRPSADHAVWQAIVIALRGLGRIVDEDATDAFQAQVRSLVVPGARASSANRPTARAISTSKLRGLLVGAAGVLGGDVGTQARCREWYDAASRDASTVDPELAAAATSVVAATGDVDVYDQMLVRFQTRQHPAGAAPPPVRAHRVRRRSADPAHVRVRHERRGEDPERTVRARARRSPTVTTARRRGRFVRDHWDEANERFPTNTIVRMADGVKLLNDPVSVDDVQSFFADASDRAGRQDARADPRTPAGQRRSAHS